MIDPLICSRMMGMVYFAAKMQLLRLIATTRSIGKLGVAAGKADADIVVQDVDPAPARLGVGHHRLDLAFTSHVGLECDRGPAFRGDHLDSLLCGSEITIDAQHGRTFARKGDRGGAAVAHAFAGTLAGTHHDGDTVFQAHVNSLCFLPL